MIKTPITDLSSDELHASAAELGLKPYSVDQLLSWLYKKRVNSFAEMTNISKPMREALSSRFEISAIEVVDKIVAKDETQKLLCEAPDGELMECVIIPADDERTTLCVSTQSGCKMGCAFCRTGKMGFRRDLTQGEIVGQVIKSIDIIKKPLTNIVLMGMGEPLENLENVSKAISLLIDERAFGLSKKRITLSTCGLIPELKEFVSRFDVKIAISLNATTDLVRDSLMPINKRYPIVEILKFCREYTGSSRYRITFEYVMIGGVNDSDEDMKRLPRLLDGIPAKINLIPFNPYEGCDLIGPNEATVERWSAYLWDAGVQTNIRASRGKEIMAACGQLAASKK